MVQQPGGSRTLSPGDKQFEKVSSPARQGHGSGYPNFSLRNPGKIGNKILKRQQVVNMPKIDGVRLDKK